MFDPLHTLRFELSRGIVRVKNGDRVVVVAARVVAEAIEIGGDRVAQAIGTSAGASCGRLVARRFGSARKVRRAPLGEVISEFNGAFAVMGLGSLCLERWGRAIAIAIEHAAIDHAAWVESFFSAALHEIADRKVACVALPHSKDGTRRVFVGSPSAATRVREWLAQGMSFREALLRLQTHVA